MKKPLSHSIKKLLVQLENRSAQERLRLLSGEDDPMLWALFGQGCREGLILLFRKHHRQIVAQVYLKRKAEGMVSLDDVKDVFSDFVEQVLAGKFAKIELKKDFPSFAVCHLSFLLKDRAKTILRRKLLMEKQSGFFEKNTNPHQRVEEAFDLGRVIDFIPQIGNRVYRMVLYLIFIEGYNSQDFFGLFGKPKLAYDKRSRAMKAFRELLEKNGILEELR